MPKDKIGGCHSFIIKCCVFCVFLMNIVFESHAVKTLQKADILDLSNNAILCMHQDQNGYMWFGTYDGLNLYNGKNNYVYRYEPDNENSINGNIIQKITDAGPDHLWIATFIGVNRFSLIERKFVASYAQYPESRLLTADTKGRTLLISLQNFVSYYSPENDSFQDIFLPGITVDNVKELFVDSSDQFYLVTTEGILKRLDINTQTIPATLKIQDIALHDMEIIHAFYEEEKIYFVDSGLRMYMYDCLKKEKKQIANISTLIRENGDISEILTWNNDIYIAFKNNGLTRINIETSVISSLPVLSNIGVFSLVKDKKQDILWIGTDGQGVQMYYEKFEMFGSLMLENLPAKAQKPVRSIYTDEYNTLWIGTKGDGIFRIKDYDVMGNQTPSANKVSHFTTAEGLSNDQVFCFLRSRYRDIVWIGTEGPGLSYYSYKEDKIFTLPVHVSGKIRRVHSICELNDSVLWLATAGDGLLEVTIKLEKAQPVVKNLDVYTFEKSGRICNEFHSMSYDNDSTLYIGSRGGYGVISFNVYSKYYDFLPLHHAESSAVGDVLSLHPSTDSIYYFGASSGLTRMHFRPEGKFYVKQFGRNDGIANDMIHGILEDATGCVWLSTNRGLTKYNPYNDFFHNYYYPDLRVTEFSDDAYWKCPHSGKLFFGGINGLVWIDPNENMQYVYSPELCFWDLNMLGERQSISGFSDIICIPPGSPDFSISFVATDYINGDNYEYSYFLENYNSSWIELQKNNEVNFINVPFGEYVLHVKYKNDVYDSDAKSYSLPIIILPPWYLTKWAISLYISGVIFIGFYIAWQIRKRLIRRQKRILREQKEKLYEAKLSFFTNITHELCTPLTLIRGVNERIKEYQDNISDENFRKYIEILDNNVNELNELIQEILDFRKIEESVSASFAIKRTCISELANMIYDSFSPMAGKDSIDFELSVPDNLYWNTDPVSIKKVLTNLVSNAFKYTKENGRISIRIMIENDSLVLKVYNTGIGIDPSNYDAVFDRYAVLEQMNENKYMQMTARTGLGLSICKSLVESLQGKISIRSEVNEFAEITVVLPYLETTEEIISGMEVGEKIVQTEIKRQEKTEDLPASRQTILIIDDNKDILWFISNTLSSEYEIKEASNGIEAIQIIEKQTPDLILTDIIMPQMDGLEFLRKIKSDKYTRHIPLIIISAKITDNEQAEGLDLGADAYITKPFSPLVLHSTVKRLLSTKNDLKEYYYSPESAYTYSDGQLVHQEDKEFLESVTDIIRDNIDKENLRPELIADKLGMNTRNLYRRFKKVSELSPSDYIKDYRFMYAARLLVTTNLTIQEIIYKVGISNKSYFYREFTKKYQMTPKEYRLRK